MEIDERTIYIAIMIASFVILFIILIVKIILKIRHHKAFVHIPLRQEKSKPSLPAQSSKPSSKSSPKISSKKIIPTKGRKDLIVTETSDEFIVQESYTPPEWRRRKYINYHKELDYVEASLSTLRETMSSLEETEQPTPLPEPELRIFPPVSASPIVKKHLRRHSSQQQLLDRELHELEARLHGYPHPKVEQTTEPSLNTAALQKEIDSLPSIPTEKTKQVRVAPATIGHSTQFHQEQEELQKQQQHLEKQLSSLSSSSISSPQIISHPRRPRVTKADRKAISDVKRITRKLERQHKIEHQPPAEITQVEKELRKIKRSK